MSHCNFKRKVKEFEAGVGRCSWGQIFECASERELAMKLIVDFDKIGIPKKACTIREQQLNEAERIRKVHN